MGTQEIIRERLAYRRRALKAAREAYLALLGGGVKSYAIGTRNLTRLDLPALENTITRLEKEVDSLEGQLSGGRARKAVGVVPRDC